MFIKIFDLLCRIIPESWKHQVKTILGAVVHDVGSDLIVSQEVLKHQRDQLSFMQDQLQQTENKAVKLERKIAEQSSEIGDLQRSLSEKENATLIDFYYQRLGQLDSDNESFLSELEELKGIRTILKRRFPSEIIYDHRTIDEPQVSIIIPVYSNHDALHALLMNLNTNNSSNQFEVIVVNDLPEEPLSKQLTENVYRFPSLFVQNQWNSGFAGACNTGAHHARGNFLLFLNSDILPRSTDWLDRMLDTMKSNSKTAIVGAKTLYPNGNLIEHFGMFPIRHQGVWKNAHYFHRIANEIFPETQIDQKVGMVTGACFLVRAELFEEWNGFNEGFLIGGFEDSDLCRRATNDGYEIRVSAGAVLGHRKSASLSRAKYYTEKVAACHESYFNHLWASTIEQDDFTIKFDRNSNNPRILFVVHGHPPEQIGGTEIYNQKLAQALERTGNFDCTILALRRLKSPDDTDGCIIADEDCSGVIPVLRCIRSDMSFINTHERAELEFEILLHSIQPEIIHFNHTEHLSTNFVEIAKRTTGQPVLYTLHEYLPICANRGLMIFSDGSLCSEAEVHKCSQCVKRTMGEIESRWDLYRRNFSQVDLFIAPSMHLKEKYVRWGMNPDSIRFIRNGIVEQHYSNERTDPAPIIQFVFIGQLLPHKGVSVLLNAAKIASESRKQRFEVHLYGNLYSGGDLSTFHNEIMQRLKDLEGTAFFHGPYAGADLPGILYIADAIIVPSTWWENCPLTILEAFQARVPVIGSKIGGIRELVEDHETGLLFEMNDAHDLAKKMISIVDQPEQLVEFRKNLRNMHIKSMQENAEEIGELYKTLLQNSVQQLLG